MRVMLVEDQVLLREGLAGLFRDAQHNVVGSLGDAAHLSELVSEQKPDVVLLDIRLPPTYTDEGTRAAAEINAAHPDGAHGRSGGPGRIRLPARGPVLDVADLWVPKTYATRRYS